MRSLIPFSLVILTSLASSAAVVIRPVASMTDRVVTSREVAISALVETTLTDAEVKPRVVQPKDADFSQMVTAALMELIISIEADNFNVASASPTEIQEATAKIKAATKNLAGWKELEVADSEITLMISRNIRAKKFIRFKTESTQVSITDIEARDYFEKNKSKFGNLPFSQFRDNIKSFLSKQQMDQRLREWFEILKKKYSARNLELEAKS